MKARMKKMAAVMAMVMVVGGSVNPVWAGTRATGEVGGYKTEGYLEVGTESASAITTYGGTGNKQSKVTVYYGKGDTIYQTPGNAATAYNCPAVATARVKVSGADVLGAAGVHTVSASKGSWTGYTDSGHQYPNAIVK